MNNRLAQESSPYLLQHADNPVHWQPWSQGALQLAQDQDKPIFLSIGYAACHWCHVMAHESFEDEETATIMNEYFINVKVDREERPDIDSIYMDAVVAMTGSGGWPLSVFLTPDGEPFFGGTYFPPESRHGMPAFRQVLHSIHQSWQTERDKIHQTGQRLAEHLSKSSSLPGKAGTELDQSQLQKAAENLHNRYDWQRGGWGNAPKFPQPAAIEYLLHRYLRQGDRLARDMALHALRSMAQGGLYDQIGGGFARYSVDANWRVPHFEKMLYDNALLLANYLQAWQLTREPHFLETAQTTFKFLQRELKVAPGGYASSLDADSEGEEGKYYIWSQQQIQSLLEPAGLADLFIEAFGVSQNGNFEGSNVLYRAKSNQDLADQFDASQQEIKSKLHAASEILFEARQSRVRPGLDDKVLTAWNGLLLMALAEGAQATGDAEWLEAAQELADFLVENLFVDGHLQRSWRAGSARFDAYLEDYAALGLGLLELYSVDFDPRWYQQSIELAEQILTRFLDPAGGFFDTPDDHEPLLTRPKSVQDSPVPSGNSLAVRLLLRLAALTGQERYRQPAETALGAMADLPSRHPTAFASWLSALAFALGPQLQLAVVGDPTSADFRRLTSVVHDRLLPDLVIAGGLPSEATRHPQLLAAREPIEGNATAFLCQGFSCQLPTTDPDLLTDQLEQALESSQ